MNCEVCSETAVIKNPKYCKEHFFEYVENKVKKAINDFKMLKKSDKVAVGVSGGKDSLSLLYILNKIGYAVTGIAVDEGIKGYRDPKFKHLKEFCEENKIKLIITSFEDNFGKNLDEMNIKAVGGMPCTPCGTFRRYLLNREAKEFNKIATGHNLDDEAQSVLMNLFKSQIEIMKRQGPITDQKKGFTVRIKPLYFLKEKEIATYAFLKGFIEKFVECPNAKLAYRIYLRDLLNDYEKENPGTKAAVVKTFINWKKTFDKKKGSIINQCKECGEPSSGETCKACLIKVKI